MKKKIKNINELIIKRKRTWSEMGFEGKPVTWVKPPKKGKGSEYKRNKKDTL